MKIYLDESGNLGGLGAKASEDDPYFLLAALVVTEDLQDKPQIVYNYLCKQLLYRIIGKYQVHTTPFVEIVVDKSLYGVQRENFNDYVGGRIGEGISVDIEVTHVDSRQCPCVQAVDFVAGAISRKYRNGDDSYYLKIKQRVIIELDFFEPKNSKVW